TIGIVVAGGRVRPVPAARIVDDAIGQAILVPPCAVQVVKRYDVATDFRSCGAIVFEWSQLSCCEIVFVIRVGQEVVRVDHRYSGAAPGRDAAYLETNQSQR